MQEKTFTLTVGSTNYALAISEAMGTKTPKVMLRGELRGNDKAALFLLVVDPFAASVRAANTSQEQSIKEIYQAALVAVEDFIHDNEWDHGGTYYGEMQHDGSFEITGTEKPSWEDGNWGTKL